MSIYTNPVKNYIQRNGFVMISNLLIDFQSELEISNDELNFIIKILKQRPGYSVHDEDLDKQVSSRTLQRRRKSLKEKKLLNYSVTKVFNQDGRVTTSGIMYDLSPLEEKLQIISDSIESKKEKIITKEMKTKGEFIEQEEDSPLQNFINDYEKYYGNKYNLSDFEREKYSRLPEEYKKIISYIFMFVKESNLLGKIVPRLSLFFKTPWRFTQLKNFCIENNFIKDLNEDFKSSVEIKKEAEDKNNKKEQEDKKEEYFILLNKVYKKYYNHELIKGVKYNKFFAKQILRIIDSFTFNYGSVYKYENAFYSNIYGVFKQYEKLGEKLIFEDEKELYDR